MMGQTYADAEISDLPTELESPQGKLVYLFLEATDGATVDDLGRTLAMKKIDVLSVLRSLSSQGLIEKRGETYVPRR